MKRLPPAQIEENLSALVNLAPDLSEELLVRCGRGAQLALWPCWDVHPAQDAVILVGFLLCRRTSISPLWSLMTRLLGSGSCCATTTATATPSGTVASSAVPYS